MDANKRTDMGLSESDVIAITKGWYENQASVQVALLKDNKYNWNLVPGRPPFPDGVGCGPGVTVFPDKCPGTPGCASGNTAFPTGCTQFLRKSCSTASPFQHMPLLMGFMNQTETLNSLDNFEQNLGEFCSTSVHFKPDRRQNEDLFRSDRSVLPIAASFLLARGDYAWIGTGYIGCGTGGRSPVCSQPQQQCPTTEYLRPAALDVDYGQPAGLCAEEPGKAGVFTRHYSRAEITLDCNKWVASIKMRK